MIPLRALLLNGSPDPAGQTMCLAGAMLEVFAAAGVESKVAHLHDLPLLPCRNCGGCGGSRETDSARPCPLDDAADGLLGVLAAANFLLVASPLHFSSLTAPVIAFFSRLQPFWLAKKRGVPPLPPLARRAALIVTAGSDYPGMFQPARSVAAAAFNSLDIPFAGVAAATDTDRLAVAENAAALAEAATLAGVMLGEVAG